MFRAELIERVDGDAQVALIASKFFDSEGSLCSFVENSLLHADASLIRSYLAEHHGAEDLADDLVEESGLIINIQDVGTEDRIVVEIFLPFDLLSQRFDHDSMRVNGNKRHKIYLAIEKILTDRF